MSRFRLRRAHPVGSEVRRVAVERLEQALADAAAATPAVAVHDTRRRTKELRALVKLVRPVAGEAVAGRTTPCGTPPVGCRVRAS